ncbi:MAG: hypothetical protein NTW04_03760 [Elusimicrobia bacterium]|nr:hypothetical protein [Elusimicrobiota bacterium]
MKKRCVKIFKPSYLISYVQGHGGDTGIHPVSNPVDIDLSFKDMEKAIQASGVVVDFLHLAACNTFSVKNLFCLSNVCKEIGGFETVDGSNLIYSPTLLNVKDALDKMYSLLDEKSPQGNLLTELPDIFMKNIKKPAGLEKVYTVYSAKNSADIKNAINVFANKAKELINSKPDLLGIFTQAIEKTGEEMSRKGFVNFGNFIHSSLGIDALQRYIKKQKDIVTLLKNMRNELSLLPQGNADVDNLIKAADEVIKRVQEATQNKVHTYSISDLSGITIDAPDISTIDELNEGNKYLSENISRYPDDKPWGIFYKTLIWHKKQDMEAKNAVALKLGMGEKRAKVIPSLPQGIPAASSVGNVDDFKLATFGNIIGKKGIESIRVGNKEIGIRLEGYINVNSGENLYTIMLWICKGKDEFAGCIGYDFKMEDEGFYIQKQNDMKINYSVYKNETGKIKIEFTPLEYFNNEDLRQGVTYEVIIDKLQNRPRGIYN